ncbi:MAG: GGDEF domain-containing protein [Cellvibrionaceae bacterium]|nr:GGDEF domain-containing protein [Cellvibrionaceae bacterium]
MTSLSNGFLMQVLNTLGNNIAVLDEHFNIVLVNDSWRNFGFENGQALDFEWLGINYRKACINAAEDGDEFSTLVLKGLDDILSGKIDQFNMDYPCHSASEDRWFNMQIESFCMDADKYFVITHKNITQRVKLEQEARTLAKQDPLTKISNRRAFDDFLSMQWRQCKRDCKPLSLLAIDLDDFKLINDRCGHQFGDTCLQQTAKVLRKYTGRASDLCARYGGEEFIIAWGNMGHTDSLRLARHVLRDLNRIKIVNRDDKLIGRLTASIGLYTAMPGVQLTEQAINSADDLMYKAKALGKNSICDGQWSAQQELFGV